MLWFVAAVAMLVLLAGSLFYASFLTSAPEARVASRLEALESRIERVEHEELRLLLTKELALLRRELDLSRGK